MVSVRSSPHSVPYRYYSRHKQVSENDGECLCERRRSGMRPYYRDSACGSGQSRVPRSKTRHQYTSILYQNLGMNQIIFKDQTLITFIVYLHMSITSGFTLLITNWDIMVGERTCSICNEHALSDIQKYI